MTGNSKESQNQALDLGTGFATSKPVISKINLDFQKSRNVPFYELTQTEAFDKTQDEIKLRNGQLGIDQVNRTVSIPRSILVAQEEKRRAAANATDQILLLAMIEDLRNRLADLEGSMAKYMQTLRGKYGEDVVGGMAQAYLSEEELQGLETDEQKMQALADKFLNPDGTIKDEYKDLDEAKYVRDWSEAQKIKPIIQKYDANPNLAAHEVQEVHDLADSLGLAGKENAHLHSNNEQVKAVVEGVIEEQRETKEVATNSTAFSFAKPT